MRISDWSSDVCSSDLSKSLKEKGMAVDAAMVERIARLARLRLEPGEAQHLETEINGILGWIEQLRQVDTDGVEPMTAVIPNKMRLRDDMVTEGGLRDGGTEVVRVGKEWVRRGGLGGGV